MEKPPTPEQYRRWWLESTDVPYGYCWCGCGQRTVTANKTDRAIPQFEGEPKRYLKGHHNRKHLLEDSYALEERGYGTPCWVWQGTFTSAGHPVYKEGGSQLRAHRFLYEIYRGSLDPEAVLHPGCGHQDCVQPFHREELTRREDLDEHGMLGSTHPSAKLTFEEAEELRDIYSSGGISQREAARLFGVSRTTAQRIIKHERYLK